MKRWAGLLLMFAVATFVVVAISMRIPSKVQPNPLERRHATIRPGMTEREVITIMDGDFPPSVSKGKDGIVPGETHHFEWAIPSEQYGSVRLRVYFDAAGRVTRTSAEVMSKL